LGKVVIFLYSPKIVFFDFPSFEGKDGKFHFSQGQPQLQVKLSLKVLFIFDPQTHMEDDIIFYILEN
jgi:hypothetical protein